MTITLKNTSDATVYTFPEYIECIDQPFSIKTNIVNRNNAHGGANVGDGKIAPRIIELIGPVFGSGQLALETTLKQLRYHCEAVAENSRRLYLSQITNEYYIPGALMDMDVNQKRYDNKSAQVSITFACLDPFRYEAGSGYPHTATFAGKSGWSTNTVPSADTGTYTSPMPPVIRVTVTAGAMPAVYITNATDDSKNISFVSPALVSGEYVEIDTNAGTCYCYGSTRFKNSTGVNMIKYLGGEFFNLLPGNNTIRIDVQGGATATVLFSWRKRWM